MPRAITSATACRRNCSTCWPACPACKVASRTSSFAYKGRNVDIREVGRELGVETVLEGSVRQAGDAGAHHRAAHRRGDRLPPLVGDLRAAAGGHLPGAGRDRRGDRGEAAHRARAAGAGAGGARQGAHAEHRRPTSSTCRVARLEEARRGQPAQGDRPLPARARPRPGIRPRLRRARLGLRRAAGLHAGGGRRGEADAARRGCGAARAVDRPEDRRGARGAGADERAARRPARRGVGVLLRDLAGAERGHTAPLVLAAAGERRAGRPGARAGAARPGTRSDLGRDRAQPRQHAPHGGRERRGAALCEAGPAARARQGHPRRRGRGRDAPRPVGRRRGG